MTAFERAQRYVGEVTELAGTESHPLIQWWLSLCRFGPNADHETPWCSAFVNGIAWEMRLPRSKSAAARSWLLVGTPVRVEEAIAGYDVVVLKRGEGKQPGPDVIAAPGHVGFYAGLEGDDVLVLGGNQSNGVSIARFKRSAVLGVRRLA